MKMVLKLLDRTKANTETLSYPCDYEMIHVFPEKISDEDIIKYVALNFDPMEIGDVILTKNGYECSIVYSEISWFDKVKVEQEWMHEFLKQNKEAEGFAYVHNDINIPREYLTPEERLNKLHKQREENEMKKTSRIRSLEL